MSKRLWYYSVGNYRQEYRSLNFVQRRRYWYYIQNPLKRRRSRPSLGRVEAI